MCGNSFGKPGRAGVNLFLLKQRGDTGAQKRRDSYGDMITKESAWFRACFFNNLPLALSAGLLVY